MKWEFINILILSLILVGAVTFAVENLSYSDDATKYTDRVAFYYMAKSPFEFDTRPEKANTIPWTYRVFVPTLIYLLPISIYNGYLLLSFFSAVGTCIVLYYFLKKVGFGRYYAILGILFYATFEWTIHFPMHTVMQTDSFSYFITTLSLYFIVNNNHKSFVGSLMVGILTKEWALILLPVYLAHNWKNGKLQAFIRTALASVPVISLMIMVRRVVPAVQWVATRVCPSCEVFTTTPMGEIYFMHHFLRYTGERLASLGSFAKFMYMATFNIWGALTIIPLFTPRTTYRYLKENLHFTVFLILCFGMTAVSMPEHAILAAPVFIAVSLNSLKVILSEIDDKVVIGSLLVVFNIILCDTFSLFVTMQEGYNTMKIALITTYIMFWAFYLFLNWRNKI